MEQSLYPGSQTFEQALCRLYLDGRVGYDEAMIASDSPTNLAWLINQNAPTSRDSEIGAGPATCASSADFGKHDDRSRDARALELRLSQALGCHSAPGSRRAASRAT